ncbi:MAG: phosphoenolpyruvate synthase [Syntrophus sp. PtaB.Bin138]|nr:MAG: phosphoenolpyruvate synthase [Syntrophus sp. PtaB.Bin138]
MEKIPARVSTGLEGLDKVIDGLRIGDNVVWQVDSISDYRSFVKPFVQHALSENRKVVYLRFAQHEPLLEENRRITRYHLDAQSGFESFSSEVYNIATREGDGVFYVFDSLSDLLSAWATDLMIGNFFRITCPYLYQLDTVAYFALLRDNHSYKTVARIRETTQVLLDVYNVEDRIYVHPLKVMGRHLPTMFLPHLKSGNRFSPVSSSVDTGQLVRYFSGKGLESAKRNLDYWDRLFLHVRDLLQGEMDDEEKGKILDHLCEIMIGREERIHELARNYLTLEDLCNIKARLIGTGYIGGKAAGMLIARKMLLQDPSFDWPRYLEPHDSFFIGSDVFYTYIVENGWWKLRMDQKTQEGYFDVARTLREQMLHGRFPDEIEEQFWRVIEYFGQSPLIVRSSSLLEDAFGNAFAGKYESLFCVNQGPPEERYRQFREAVRRIFASTMNEDALAYRLQRGLEQHDEQMALLVQRVSGSYRKEFFFPDLAGVGISYNTFVWKKEMDPRAGMVRLVLGLGTRAVNRVENDYPRVFPLDAPSLRPHSGGSDIRRYSQHDVDVLNIGKNEFETIPANAVLSGDMGIQSEMVGIRDHESEQLLKERGRGGEERWILTFDRLLSETPFPGVMQNIMKTLEEKYDYPVDIEFTTNFTGDGAFMINLVQCRPLQTKGRREGTRVDIPSKPALEQILFQTEGNFMGGSIAQGLKRLVYVDYEEYSRLSLSEKYDVARLIGRLNRISKREDCPAILLGPGRWGTTTPSLGVPVRFAEINNFVAIVEIAYMTGSLMPELSYGTHFFQDLVETDIFYVALFPEQEEFLFNVGVIREGENRLPVLLPESARHGKTVIVRDVEKEEFSLFADIVSRKVLCYRSIIR